MLNNMPVQDLPSISLKRAYAAPSDEDGSRLLVERLWPRGVRRDAASIDNWFKDLAPSPDLRRWYNHDLERWPEFRRRYQAELQSCDPETMGELLAFCTGGPVTFIFAARDTEHNSAVVLRDHVLSLIAEE